VGLKNAAVRIGIIGFGVLVAGLAYESAHRPADPPELMALQRSVAHDIAEKAVASVGAADRWSGITIDAADLSAYRMTIYFAREPTPAEVEGDTRALASAVLLQLTFSGHHASDEDTVIVVQARHGDEPAVLGTASFIAAADKVVFAAR
jgi:hypothetical protein